MRRAGRWRCVRCFFFNDTATTEIYTLSLHDALPISQPGEQSTPAPGSKTTAIRNWSRDRKSTRLNSSHGYISYAVFCLKKKIIMALAAKQLLEIGNRHSCGDLVVFR